MRFKICIFISSIISGIISAQNPISPPGFYLADPSAHVWNDGRLYLYGSLDESCNYYCSNRHHVISTDNLKSWQLHKNALVSSGEGDGISYNDNLLYAPDVSYKRDTFYMYYCQPGKDFAEGVATSTNPTGPFTNGININLKGYNQIDPSVFADDDGQSYYLWGQFTLKMGKLKPNMKELDLNTVRDSILTEGSHHFHEGAFLTKREGIYYLVFADISRGDAPTCLGYATSKSPFGPYKYGGVIIDNNYCNPGNWNNHGSIAEYRGKWYVFYHRSTHGCNTMRKACMEPISFNPDGSISEVEMTSQGAGEPLNPLTTIQAEWACLLSGNLRISQFADEEEELGMINNGDKFCYKYIDFGKSTKSLTIKYLSTGKTGKLQIYIDKPWHMKIAEAEIKSSGENRKWQTIIVPVEKVSGIHSLWFQFNSKEEKGLLSIDWLRFD